VHHLGHGGHDVPGDPSQRPVVRGDRLLQAGVGERAEELERALGLVLPALLEVGDVNRLANIFDIPQPFVYIRLKRMGLI
jgi:hypothetical protein